MMLTLEVQCVVYELEGLAHVRAVQIGGPLILLAVAVWKEGQWGRDGGRTLEIVRHERKSVPSKVHYL